MEIFWKVYFLKAVEALVICSLDMFNLVRQWLWIVKVPKVKVDLWPFSLGCSDWSLINILNIVFSQTIDQIELKFHVKTPCGKLAKKYTKYVGHMTKMTATPIYGKNHFKIFSRTRRPVTLGLGMQHWGCRAYQVCLSDDPKMTMICLTSRSDLLPNAFKWDFFWKVDFSNTVDAKVIILAWYVESNGDIGYE